MRISRPAQMLLLALALVPSCIVLAIAIYVLLSGGNAQIHWHMTILVALQIASIAAFSRHARQNSALSPSQADKWIMQFIVFIPIGMLSYWDKHVRG